VTVEDKTKPTGRPAKPKRRPLVPKAELWDRNQRLEMAKLAEEFVKAREKVA
jgi:hypothetical protein